MQRVAQIGVSILGIYLITRAFSLHARSFWCLSSSAGLRDYVMVFSPSVILFCGGVICLVLRHYISSWIFKGQKTDLPADVDLDRVECIVLSLIGIMVVLEVVPYIALTINHLFATSGIQITESVELPMRSYAFVQTIAAVVEFCLACALIFFPHKVQAILRRTRGF